MLRHFNHLSAQQLQTKTPNTLKKRHQKNHLNINSGAAPEILRDNRLTYPNAEVISPWVQQDNSPTWSVLHVTCQPTVPGTYRDWNM
ncbi:hypothetical protein Y1Q_0003373 [Alligator mississippiensis]|uniref:Uncharacterized protein n=1 Tax=Alligator mississippiensis TaxID=8496 RepID=A0A151MAX7_ALLMI|nr:hypothetical protein Y1Q_0003373 [Alligator mississippiensis]